MQAPNCAARANRAAHADQAHGESLYLVLQGRGLTLVFLSVVQVTRAAVPWLMVLLVFLVLMTYIPAISLALPAATDRLGCQAEHQFAGIRSNKGRNWLIGLSSPTSESGPFTGAYHGANVSP